MKPPSYPLKPDYYKNEFRNNQLKTPPHKDFQGLYPVKSGIKQTYYNTINTNPNNLFNQQTPSNNATFYREDTNKNNRNEAVKNSIEKLMLKPSLKKTPSSISNNSMITGGREMNKTNEGFVRMGNPNESFINKNARIGVKTVHFANKIDSNATHVSPNVG